METVLIVALAFLCTVTPLWLGARYGVVGLVSPMHLLGYFCLFGFLVKVAVFGFVPNYAFYARYVDTPGALMKGSLYLSAFIMLLCLGYRCAVRPIRTDLCVNAARGIAANVTHRGLLFCLAFGVAALTLMLLLQARGASALSVDVLSKLNTDKQINVNADGVGATLAGIKTFFIVPKVAFVLLLAQGIVLRNRWLFVQAAVLAVLLVFIALVSGDRFELVEMLVFGAATYVILGGRLRLQTWCVTIAAAMIVLALSAYMTALRGNDAGLLHQIVGSTYFLDINASVMVTDRVTPDMLLLGESYSWWSFGWIPRAIWVDKPAIDLGVFFKQDVMGVMTGGAFNVTGPGEAFINFGWAGVLVGFALGWIYRRGEEALLNAQNTLRYAAFLLYPLILYPFIQASLQSSFSGFIVGAAAQLILIAAMIAVFVPRYRFKQRTAHYLKGHVHV